jgi:hypothetical protein
VPPAEESGVPFTFGNFLKHLKSCLILFGIAFGLLWAANIFTGDDDNALRGDWTGLAVEYGTSVLIVSGFMACFLAWIGQFPLKTMSKAKESEKPHHPDHEE